MKKERAAEASKVKATQETPNEEIKVVKVVGYDFYVME